MKAIWFQPFFVAAILLLSCTARESAVAQPPPLILGNDLRNIPKGVLKIITNGDVIALNQDRLCQQAEKVEDAGDIETFAKFLANGDVGVCVLNRADATQKVALNRNTLGLKKGEAWHVRDLWEHKDIAELTDQVHMVVPSHDVATYRLSPLTKEANHRE